MLRITRHVAARIARDAARPGALGRCWSKRAKASRRGWTPLRPGGWKCGSAPAPTATSEARRMRPPVRVLYGSSPTCLAPRLHATIPGFTTRRGLRTDRARIRKRPRGGARTRGRGALDRRERRRSPAGGARRIEAAGPQRRQDRQRVFVSEAFCTSTRHHDAASRRTTSATSCAGERQRGGRARPGRTACGCRFTLCRARLAGGRGRRAFERSAHPGRGCS